MITEPQRTEKSTPHINLQKLWSLIATRVLNLASITALLTIAGFFVIHSYLATLTNLSTINIGIYQYLIAGINLVLGLFAYALPVILGVVIVVILYLIIGIIGSLFLSPLNWLNRIYRKGTGYLKGKIVPLSPQIKRLWHSYQIVTITLYTMLIVFIGIGYGTFLYATSPRMLGGGKSYAAILVFSQPQLNVMSGTRDYPVQWPFPINQSYPKQSEVIEIIMELSDGVLVRDPNTKIAVIIKSNVIEAIIDVSPRVSSP